MKKMYETCWEVINLCANNQMRDVFFDEVDVEDPEKGGAMSPTTVIRKSF